MQNYDWTHTGKYFHVSGDKGPKLGPILRNLEIYHKVAHTSQVSNFKALDAKLCLKSCTKLFAHFARLQIGPNIATKIKICNEVAYTNHVSNLKALDAKLF